MAPKEAALAEKKVGRRSALARELLDLVSRRDTIQRSITAELLSAVTSHPDREYRIHDTGFDGLQLRVRPNGQLRWLLRYTTTKGQRRLETLGSPAEVTPDQARQRARELAGRMALGGDPALEKSAARAQLSLNQLLDAYLDAPPQRGSGAKRSEKTTRDYQGFLEREVRPKLGSRKLGDVTRRDVDALHRAIAARSPRTANLVLAILKAAFNYAERLEITPLNTNPAAKIRKAAEVVRKDDYRVDPTELAAYARALGRFAAAAETPQARGAAMGLRILLTRGLRTGEVLSLAWASVSNDANTAKVTGKTGKRTVHFASSVADGLRRLRAQDCGQYVVAGRYRDSPMDYSAFRRFHRKVIEASKAELDAERAEHLDGLRLHDLRHHFLFEAGLRAQNAATLRDLAGHATLTTTNIYLDKYEDPRELLDAIAKGVGGNDAGAQP